MGMETLGEKVLLSSIAASVALSGPISTEAASEGMNVHNVTINKKDRFTFGQKGYQLFSIQKKLLDYELTVTDEEVFRLKTHAVIRKFKKLKKLQVDGVGGPDTLTALFINDNIDEIVVDDYILVEIIEGLKFRLGDKGNAVKEIQKLLKEAGYYHYEKDGNFGDRTKEAVIQYQTDHGLNIDGIVGEETYQHLAGVSMKTKLDSQKNVQHSVTVYAHEEDMALLGTPLINETVEIPEKDNINTVDNLRYGDRGQAVKDLQSLLKRKGYYQHKVDGIFGPNTETSVRNYQQTHHLAVDGVAGQSTIKHLETSSKTTVASRSASTGITEKKDTVTTTPSTTTIINTAKQYIGTRYVWGGASPSGFDCSGFLMYVYKRNGKSIPRTVTDIWNVGKSVDALQVGDIVFYETYKKGPSHAGIYLGNNQFIHASSKGVMISDMTIHYWTSRYIGAKRIQ